VPEATVIPPGGGEVIGDSPERRVEILCDDEALNATCSRFAAGRAGADLHVHRNHSDIFYVLEGELTVMLGVDGERVGVPAGAWVQVPAGTAYELSFPEAARFLELRAPR
jgi:mannose-6-phosphate isomerase-like protein (cupin superfamily)